MQQIAQLWMNTLFFNRRSEETQSSSIAPQQGGLWAEDLGF